MSNETKNQVFLIAGIRNPDAISIKLQELDIKSIALSETSWLAIFAGTTREFAELVGIRKGDIGASGLVVTVGNYSGRAPNEVWEWLKLNWPENE